MRIHKTGEDAVLSLFELYEKKMYHIAYAILQDSYQAEDAVMDAFVKLLERNYEIKDPGSDTAKRLIIQLIRSSAIDLYRKNQRERDRQMLSEDPTLHLPVDFTQSQKEDPAFVLSEDIESLISELAPIYRDVLELRYGKDYSVRETAAKLGISEDTVRKRQERALRMLKEIQSGRSQDEPAKRKQKDTYPDRTFNKNRSDRGGRIYETSFRVI